MRRAWRGVTALRKADEAFAKDVDLERLRHDYDRLKQELETVEVQGRSELERAARCALSLRSGYERSAVTLRRRDRARIERERRDTEIAQLSRELELPRRTQPADLRAAPSPRRATQRSSGAQRRATATEQALGHLDGEAIAEQRDQLNTHQATIADLNSKIDSLADQMADRSSQISAASALSATVNSGSADGAWAAEEQWQTLKEERAARRRARHAAPPRAGSGAPQTMKLGFTLRASSLRGAHSRRAWRSGEELISARTRLETELERQAAQLGEARQRWRSW